jgi:hypothetical protein
MGDRSDQPQSPHRDPRTKLPLVDLTVRSKRFVRAIIAVCVVAEVAFVVLDYHVNYGGLTEIGTLRRLTNIAREDSAASWFGTTQMLFVGLTLWLIYFAIRHRESTRWQRGGWLILAAFFSFMAVDDGIMLHERAGTVISRIQSSDVSAGEATSIPAKALEVFPSYSWQVVVLPIFAVLGLFALVFLWRELGERRSKVIVALALACFALAVGLDFLEGLDPGHAWNPYTRITKWVDIGDFTFHRFGKSPYVTLRHFSKSIEEFLEMFAGTLLWFVFLRELTRVAADSRVRFV